MLLSREDSIALLKKITEENFEGIFKHSKAVETLAIHIASQIECDIDLVVAGSLLHDIGRSKYPPKSNNAILHGVEGAKILKNNGIDQRIISITERHIGAGITVKDIEKQKIPIPKKDYLPTTIEEKIVAYADNCVKYDEILDVDYPISRFYKSLGIDHANRVIILHNELVKHGYKININNNIVKKKNLLTGEHNG